MSDNRLIWQGELSGSRYRVVRSDNNLDGFVVEEGVDDSLGQPSWRQVEYDDAEEPWVSVVVEALVGTHDEVLKLMGAVREAFEPGRLTRKQAMAPSPILADVPMVEAPPGPHVCKVETPLPDGDDIYLDGDGRAYEPAPDPEKSMPR